MSYLMGRLLALQEQKRAFERLMREAPMLGLPRADTAHLAQLLRTVPGDDLRQLLLRSSTPAPILSASPLLVSTARDLLTEEPGREALADYPLDSSKMLGAARAHGIDEHILSEVHQEIQDRR